MTAISVTKARDNVYQILSDVNNNSQPITITNNRGKMASHIRGRLECHSNINLIFPFNDTAMG